MVKSPVLNLVGDGWTHTLWKMDIYIYVICISHIINNLNMPFGWYVSSWFWYGENRLLVGLRIDILAPVVLQMNPVDFWRATCNLADENPQGGGHGHLLSPPLMTTGNLWELDYCNLYMELGWWVYTFYYIYIYIIWKNWWEFSNPLAHMMPANIC